MPAAVVEPWQTIAPSDRGRNPRAPRGHVKDAQTLLSGFLPDRRKPTGWGSFHPGAVDGVDGPLFYGAVKRAKDALGYPSGGIDPSFGPRLHAFLTDERPLPTAFRIRRARRFRARRSELGVRRNMQHAMLFGIAHEPEIHYSQVRPMQIFHKQYTIPGGGLYVDCSAWYTMCAKWAGAPDPNGLKYNGAGYTGTMADHLREIPLSAAQIGDAVIFGVPTTHHVAGILSEEGSLDPWLASHGFEGGPLRIRLRNELRFHQGEGGFRVYSML